MTQLVTLDDMQTLDWARVRSIYAEGLATGLAAFMTTPPIWNSWDASHFPFGRLVARRERKIAGWAALARVADT